MDKDKVKGAIDDSIGRTKRQIGEWTGDTDAQVEGAAQQVKGKTEKAVGNVKDAARDFQKKAEERDSNTTLSEEERSEQEHPVSSHG